MKKILSLICLTAMAAVLLCSCQDAQKVSDRDNLMKDISVSETDEEESYRYTDGSITAPASYSEFRSGACDFAFNLFRETYTPGSNTTIAPANVYLELSLMANAAQKETKNELLSLTGNKINSENLNECSQYFETRLAAFNDKSQEKNYFINLKNALWCNDTFDVKKDFLTVNAKYYDIDAYRFLFSDSNAGAKIKNWLKDSAETDGDPLITPSEDADMYLTSALTISDEWLEAYGDNSTEKDTFAGTDKNTAAEYNISSEYYLQDGRSTGFIKSFKNTPLKLVIMLPNEDATLEDCVKNLSGESFRGFLNSLDAFKKCNAYLPGFSAETSCDLTEALQNMGLKEAFTEDANFKNMTRAEAQLDQVTQNLQLDISRFGISKSSASEDAEKGSLPENEITVKVNRPFLFAVIDNESEIPLYIGTVENI